MPAYDPVMAVQDKLPLSKLHDDTVPDVVPAAHAGPSPFGLRFAVVPVVPSDKHKKTYYTVTVKEATQVSQDGKVVTVQDDVQQERRTDVSVLVLTAHDDDTAARVCQALARRGHDHVRMDLGDFPEKLSFSASGPAHGWSGRLSNSQRDLPLSDVKAVYWRRPTNFRIPAHLDDQQRRFATAEARQGLGGLISCLPVPFVNHPSRVADAELKPAQLRAAAESGFAVPSTLITSSGTEARKFADRYGRVLYKPLTSFFLREADRVKLVYATLVEAADIDDASLALSPCQFQEFIPKSHDVRLIAVGKECFAAAIHAGSEKSYVDWRADYSSLSYEPIETPTHVAQAVRAYLQWFGLSFGCFDFTVSADTGEWIFLECGANAQWGWLEHETGLPIADTIARQLTGDAS